MKIIILAAGYGTRLYPLTLNKPKPLLPVNNKAIINFLVDKIDVLKKKFPVTDLRVVSNHKFYRNFSAWQRKNGVKAKILDDGSSTPQERAGAVRDIKFAIKKESGDWLVLGGDNLFEDDLTDFIKFSFRHKPYPCIGLYDLKSKRTASRFGVVKLNLQGRIVELKEKPRRPFSTLVATCIYFFPAGCLKLLNLFLGQSGNLDASGKYIEWLTRQTKVYGYRLRGKWLDIGHKDSLKYAARHFG